jgi:DNA-binding transcriptional LysR family regulator
MCKPGTVKKKGEKITASELASQQLLIQGTQSGAGLIYGEWFRKTGFSPRSSITSNNLLAMIGMTVAGLGVSYLPKDCLDEMIGSGLLEEIESSPPLPEINYVAMYAWEKKSSLVSSIVMLAQGCCDFSKVFGARFLAKSSKAMIVQ